jgi:hypothetical protein
MKSFRVEATFCSMLSSMQFLLLLTLRMCDIPKDLSSSCLDAVSYDPRYRKPLMIVVGMQLS